MNLISAIVLLSVLGVVLAPAAGWFVRSGYVGLGSFVNRGDSAAWWRATMPWPQGVQEEDGVRWHFRDPDEGPGSSAGWPEPREVETDAFEVAPARPHPHIGLRPPRPPA